MRRIKLAIVDDDQLIVSLLNDFFIRNTAFEVLLTANSGEEFLETLPSGPLPDVVILDLKMKAMNGAEVTQLLKDNYPTIRTVVMSSHYQKSFMGFMMKSGVSAFIPKGISPDELLKIVQEVEQRGYYFLPEQLEVIQKQIAKSAPQPILEEVDRLSEREIEVLKLICHQKTAKEIADTLCIAPRTVEGHKNNLFAKTGTKNIAGLVIYAVQHRLIETDQIPLW